jgi:hypothetical protein
MKLSDAPPRLAEIHVANVHRLQRAWEHKTGDVVYVTTPSLMVVAPSDSESVSRCILPA